jgi:adenylylsulfate kinase-like enzyme
MPDSLPPPRIVIPPDPVLEVYKRDVDRTLLRENLKLTVEQRIRQHRRVSELAAELRKAGRT